MEQAVLADKIGIHSFGIGEHHRADFAVSAPDVVLSAIAARTTNIILGSAVTVLSADDPVRVFERFSTLNALSNGRAEVIVGRGWFTEAFALFGHDPKNYDSLFDEKFDLYMSINRGHAGSGRIRSLPNQIKEGVYPPIEAGILRTWLAVGSTPKSILMAASYEVPMMLAAIGGTAQRFLPFVNLYKEAFRKIQKPQAEIGLHSVGYLSETDAQAQEEFWPHYKKYRDKIGTERGWPPIQRQQYDLEIQKGSLYIGSHETVAKKIVASATILGASRFDLKFSTGQLSHEKIMRSIEIYGRHVLPMVLDLMS